MAKLPSIEVAYQYLQDKPNGVVFNEVWNNIASEIHADNEDKTKLIADLYSDMVLDNRFALTIDGKWALRSSMTLDDIKKKYDFIDSFDLNKDFDDLDEESEVAIDEDEDPDYEAKNDDEDEDEYEDSEDIYDDEDEDE